MRKLGVFWFIHLVATVAGWYFLSALAQGALDSGAGVTAPLIVFNIFIQILCFPVVLCARMFFAYIGDFSLGSLAVFIVIAAINSAVVVAVIAAIIAALRRRNATSE